MNENEFVDAQCAYEERHTAEKLMETRGFTVRTETYIHYDELFGMLPQHEYQIIGERYHRDGSKSMMLYDVDTGHGVARNIPSCYFTPLEPKLKHSDEDQKDFTLDIRETYEEMVKNGMLDPTSPDCIAQPNPNLLKNTLKDIRNLVKTTKNEIIKELAKNNNLLEKEVPDLDLVKLAGLDHSNRSKEEYQNTLIDSLAFLKSMEVSVTNHMYKL